MSATTPLTDTRTAESAIYSPDLGQRSFSAREQLMLFSFGDGSLTEADRKELIALFSGTKPHANSSPPTLSDRLTPSLFSSGLVSGITPTSIRERLGAAIPDFVLLLPGGGRVEQQKGVCGFWNSRLRDPTTPPSSITSPSTPQEDTSNG